MRKWIFAALCLPFAVQSAPLIQNFRAEKTVSSGAVINLAGKMTEVIIPRLNNPAPDGSSGWENACTFKNFTVLYRNAEALARGMQAQGDWRHFLPQTLKPKQPTALQLGFDDKFLYLHVTCFESQMAKTMAEPSKKRDSRVYSADCIDLILTPNRNHLSYAQIVADIGGTTYDAFCRKDGKKFVSDPSWNPPLKVRSVKKSDRWELFMGIPFAAFAPEAKEGGFIEMNVNRNELPSHELSSWSPVQSSFHEIASLVRVHLGRKSQSSGAVLKQIITPAWRCGENTLTVTTTPGDAEKLHFSAAGKQAYSTTCKVSSKQKIRWQLSKPGKYLLEFSLKNKQGALCDSTAFTAEIPEPLKVQLRTLEFAAGSKSIPGMILCPYRPLDRVELRVTAGTQKQVLPLKAEKYTFELNTANFKGKVPLKFELYKNNKLLPGCSKSFTLTVAEDPFGEE